MRPSTRSTSRLASAAATSAGARSSGRRWGAMNEVEYEIISGLLWNDLLNALNNIFCADKELQFNWRNLAYEFVEPVLDEGQVELVDFTGDWDRQPYIWHLRDNANGSRFQWQSRGGPEAFRYAELNFADGRSFGGRV